MRTFTEAGATAVGTGSVTPTADPTPTPAAASTPDAGTASPPDAIGKLTGSLFPRLERELDNFRNAINKLTVSATNRASGHEPIPGVSHSAMPKRSLENIPAWRGVRGVLRSLWYGKAADNPDYVSWQNGGYHEHYKVMVIDRANYMVEGIMEKLVYPAIRPLMEDQNDMANAINRNVELLKNYLKQNITRYLRVAYTMGTKGGSSVDLPQDEPARAMPPTSSASTPAPTKSKPQPTVQKSVGGYSPGDNVEISRDGTNWFPGKVTGTFDKGGSDNGMSSLNVRTTGDSAGLGSSGDLNVYPNDPSSGLQIRKAGSKKSKAGKPAKPAGPIPGAEGAGEPVEGPAIGAKPQKVKLTPQEKADAEIAGIPKDMLEKAYRRAAEIADEEHHDELDWWNEKGDFNDQDEKAKMLKGISDVLGIPVKKLNDPKYKNLLQDILGPLSYGHPNSKKKKDHNIDDLEKKSRLGEHRGLFPDQLNEVNQLPISKRAKYYLKLVRRTGSEGFCGLC